VAAVAKCILVTIELGATAARLPLADQAATVLADLSHRHVVTALKPGPGRRAEPGDSLDADPSHCVLLKWANQRGRQLKQQQLLELHPMGLLLLLLLQ
jgi:hypothetical protein